MEVILKPCSGNLIVYFSGDHLMNNTQLSINIAIAVLDLVATEGKHIIVNRENYRPIEINIGNLFIIYSTPFTRLPGAEREYLIDIWDDQKKVFSVRWKDEINNLTIISFKRDKWVDILYKII